MIREVFADHPLVNFFIQSENIGVDINKLSIKSGKKLNLKCPICNHIFVLSPHGLKGCRFCKHQCLCEDINCSMCFTNSLASRQCINLETYKKYLILKDCNLLNKECAILDSDHLENKVNDPRMIFKSSCKSIYFNCWRCKHSFISQPRRVADLKDCPYCSPTNSRLLCPKEKKCKMCFERSFASHSKSNCWDYESPKNIGKTPYDVLKSGTFEAEFICDECNHSFIKTCNTVSSGFWCAYCAGQKRCDDKDCILCTKRKLSSHILSSNWNTILNPKNITPNDIALTNGRDKFWFNCSEDKNHPPYEKTPSKIARNQSCPLCVRKTESKLGSFLNINKIICIKEFAPTWLRSGIKNSFPRFDFTSESLKIIIELDGRQHFQTIKNWGEHIDTQENDITKMKKAVQNGYSGIRLYQPDVFEDTYDWKVWVLDVLKIIKQYNGCIWIFPNNSIYENHISKCKEHSINTLIV